VLLGTGAHQIFPVASFGAQFLRAGIGFGSMDTGRGVPYFSTYWWLSTGSRGIAAGVKKTKKNSRAVSEYQ